MKYSDRELEKADEWLGMSPEEQMYTSGKQQVHEQKEQDVCPVCKGKEYQLGDDPCEDCQGTGKVDKIREAFEKEYDVYGFCEFSKGMYEFKTSANINAHSSMSLKGLNREYRIFASGYKSQQAEMERLKAENEAMKCCGNCDNKDYRGYHPMCAIDLSSTGDGSGVCKSWQPKENN